MKKLIAKGFILVAAVPFIASCSGSVRDNLGMRRSAPNEFRVVSNPPLSVPPEFSLRPPVEDDVYVPPKSVAIDAKNVLFKQGSSSVASDNETASEEVFRSQFKGSDANPQIKSLLQHEFLEAAKKQEEESFIEKNLISKIPGLSKDKKVADPAVNARLEKDRIVQEQKKGEKVTGVDTPTVESKNHDRGLLNKILGL
jgi:hypothetical protein